MRLQNHRLELIPLESREAPAVLVDGATVRYQDTDGDLVTVSLTKSVLTDTNANTIFAFSSGPLAINGSLNQREQLQAINLTSLGQEAKGVGITVTSARNAVTGGDGFAAVGRIDGTGFDLGNMVIDGDLTEIRAGDNKTKSPGLGGLTAQSMGRYGTDTGGSLNSQIVGRVGSIAVKSSIVGVTIDVTGDAESVGNLGSLTVGGSLIGGAGLRSGSVLVSGSIGNVVIGGSLIGGLGIESGAIVAGEKIGDLTVRGSFIGGIGDDSASISVDGGGLGTIKISGDLVGNGPRSASLRAEGGARSVSVGGSLIGSAGDESGALRFLDDVGPLVIGHDLVGSAFQSGRASARSFSRVTVGGSIIGGVEEDSGQVAASNGMGNVLVKGDLRGGDGTGSAMINSGTGMGRVTILGSMVGGVGPNSASISAMNDLAGVAITGSIRGGDGSNSARVIAGGRLLGTTPLGLPLGITVRGSIVGGPGVGSANVRAGRDIGPVVVLGSIDGSAGNVTISAVGAPAPLTTDIAIRSVKVAGELINSTILAGHDVLGAGVNADAQIGRVTVGGDWIASSLAAGVIAGVDGSFGTADDAPILEPNQLPGVPSRIAGVRIGGQVIGSADPSTSFGIVAQVVGALSIGGSAIPLTAGPDLFSFGQYQDVSLREI